MKCFAMLKKWIKNYFKKMHRFQQYLSFTMKVKHIYVYEDYEHDLSARYV